jgi:hypothetical protein
MDILLVPYYILYYLFIATVYVLAPNPVNSVNDVPKFLDIYALLFVGSEGRILNLLTTIVFPFCDVAVLLNNIPPTGALFDVTTNNAGTPSINNLSTNQAGIQFTATSSGGYIVAGLRAAAEL